MSYNLQDNQCADEDLMEAKCSGEISQELHSKSDKLNRFLHFGMLANSHDSEAVRLTGVNPLPTGEKLTQIKGESRQSLHESSLNCNRILGPTGTVRGVKNIVKSRKELLKGSADRNQLKKVEEEIGKIVIYTTSFGGVRSTEKECRFVTSIFDNLGLKYDVRDIFMQKEYQKELDARTEVSGTSVPQVFVNGFHLGGVKELEHLNETEQLKSLLSDFERRNGHVCQTCGGYRYVNCIKCHGSKKARTTRISREISLLRCTSCNENGIQRCPDCSI